MRTSSLYAGVALAMLMGTLGALPAGAAGQDVIVVPQLQAPETPSALAASSPPAPSAAVPNPPAAYGTLVIDAPSPPPAYGAGVAAAAPLYPANRYDQGTPRTDPIGLRVLAELGGYLLGGIATVGLFAVVLAATDTDNRPMPLVLTALVGYFVLMPVGAWLAGNAVEGRGELGWTLLANAFFSVFGAVVAYEVSNAFASPSSNRAGWTAALGAQSARAHGVGFTLTF